MRHLKAPIFAGFCLMAGVGAIFLSPVTAQPFKDQSRLPSGNRAGQKVSAAQTNPLRASANRERGKSDLLVPDDASQPDAIGSISDMAVVETTELSLDAARRALDAYAAVREKYSDEGLRRGQTLEDYAASGATGRRFAADIAAFGFSGVTEWTRVIASIGFALDAVVDNTEPALKAEIARVSADTAMASDLRARLIAGLKAQIPSENNKVIVRQLILDPLYRDKLALLAVYE